MRGMSSVVKTSSAAVKSGNGRVSSVILAAGSDAATVIIDDSTDGSGTDKIKLAAAANTSEAICFGDYPVLFGTGIYATLTGTSPAVTVVYE